ncbi:MAG: ABC transporter permease [Agriterribacter sp.]
MLRNYIKTAWRNITRHKIYSIINITGLAMGLAAFWLITLYIGDEWSYDRFNANADRIVRVTQQARWNNNEIKQANTSPPFAAALKSRFPEIEDAARIDLEGGGIITYNEKKIKQEDIFFADKSLLKIFTYHFLYGNAATGLSSPESIVITESLANKIFGTAEKGYNQTIIFDGKFPAVVTGIIKDIPGNSHLRFSAVRAMPADYGADNWQNFSIYTYLLLKKEADYKLLQSKLPAFAKETIQKIMKVDDYKMELQPLASIHLHSDLEFELSSNGNIKRVYIFMAIAALILLIAIINYMNLSTARSSTRLKEIGVRKVIGSEKKHIAGMFMAEAILITCISAVIAALLVQLLLPLFNNLTEKNLSVNHFGIYVTVISLIGFSILTGTISGIYPSFLLSRFKTIPALKGQMGNMSGNVFFRKSLVVLQFVITVIMIAASIIIYQQLSYVKTTNLGFNKDQVLTFHIDDRNVRTQIAAIKNQLLQNPVIEGAAAAGNPIGNNDLGGMGYRFEKEGGGFSTATTLAQELMIDADFIPTMDVKLLQGRNFSAANPSDKYGSALINETLMKKLGWKDATGKRLQFSIDSDGTTIERTIVGVIKDFHTYSLQHTIEPLVMVMPPAPQAEDNLYVKIAKGKTAEGLAYITAVYNRFDKTNQATYHFLDQNFAKQYKAEEKQGKIALIFAILAVAIACLGLFGLVTFTAAQRTKEIGIRKVLGATIPGIVAMLSSDFLKLIGIAIIIAIPVAWWAMHKWLQDFPYRIHVQGWVLISAGAIAVIIALCTVCIRAIQAAIANPVKALRSE